MAELVVIGYAKEAEAHEVMGVLRGLERDHVIETAAGAVVVRDDDGELRVTTKTHATSATPECAALWGLILGLVFFVPPTQTSSGAPDSLLGTTADLGIGDAFRQQVAELLRPGTAVAVMLFQKPTPDRTVDALAPYGGTVLRAVLSDAAEEHLGQASSSGRTLPSEP